MAHSVKSAIFIATTLIILGIVFFKPFYHDVNAKEVSTNIQAKPKAMPVNVAIVKEVPMHLWQTFSGHLAAIDYVEIRPQTSGEITEIKFNDGQLVKKGDILYVIDPRQLKAIVEQKKANLIAAQNDYSFATKEYIRAKELFAKKTVSQQFYDERRKTKLVTESAVNSASAELNEAKINLNYAYVKAPISGRISRTELTIGNLVSAGANAPLLTSIVSVGKIYADFDVDEQTYIDYVHGMSTTKEKANNNPVELYLQNDNEVYRGKIHSFDNRIDSRSGTIRTRAIFDNPKGKLLPGMYAHLKLGSATQQKKILISERAIGTDQNRKFVYVVNKENKASYREVQLGNSIDGNRIILSGLVVGDKVIIQGLMRIHPNMLVSPEISTSAETKPAQ